MPLEFSPPIGERYDEERMASKLTRLAAQVRKTMKVFARAGGRTPRVTREGLSCCFLGRGIDERDGHTPLEDHVAADIGRVGGCPVGQEAVRRDDVAGLQARHHHPRRGQQLALGGELDLAPVYRRVGSADA